MKEKEEIIIDVDFSDFIEYLQNFKMVNCNGTEQLFDDLSKFKTEKK